MGNGLTSSIQTSSDYDPNSVGGTSALWLLGGVKWGSAVGTGVRLTYSFGSANSFYDAYASYAEPYDGYSVMTKAEQTNALAAMKSYANVAGITFTQVTDTATSAGDIRWANSTSDATAYAWAYFPGRSALSGDVWNNPDIATPLVNEQFYVFAHELGHALGLSHPHAEGGRLTPVAPSSRDSVKYTVMSYNDYVNDDNDNDESDYYPNTLMIDDIRTVQALYGKNLAYRSGDTTYQWTAGSVIYETIWDGGGIDTIDASNQLAGVSINLNPGTFSAIGKAFFNGLATVRDCLGIAYGCSIEDAVGSAYSDTLQGNSLANDLAGDAGNDTVRGAAGNDWLYGDGGSDQLYGGTGSDLIWGHDDNDRLYGEDGHDKLNGGAGADSMYGGLGNDTYYVNSTLDVVSESDALGGTDTVSASISYRLGTHVENLVLTGSGAMSATGSTVANKLTGNAAANVLNGGAGADTMTGGLGNDIFVFSTSLSAVTNVDTITDFSKVSGNTDKIYLDDDIFTALGSVTQTSALSAAAFCAGKVATAQSHRIVYDSSTGHLFYDADGSGAAAQVKVALIGLGGVALTASYFAIAP